MSNIKIPGYKILKQLGQGGMSSVFLAEQMSFGREVAVKVMSQQLAEKEHFGERFLREARIAAQLAHPNIVSVYDTGFADGAYFLAMEYLAGGHLGHRLSAGLALLESLDIIEDAAYALDHAASKAVIHRDIKPGNIMFRTDGSLALVDFGIARDLSTETLVTQAGTVLGTPHYMSPEQSIGEPMDNRSDLYSLGVVFFELLTGHVPFSADSAAAVGIKHLTEDIPELPEDLAIFQPIIDKILAKSPDDRYQTGAELVADLVELRDLIPPDLHTTILTSNAYVFDTGSMRTPGAEPRSRRNTTRRRRRSSRRRRRKAVSRWLAGAAIMLAALAVGFYILVPRGTVSDWIAGATPAGTTAESQPDSPALRPPPAPAVEAESLQPDAAFGEDPEGLRLNTLALQYIERANQALDTGLLPQAQNFIDLAVALTPTEPDTVEALNGLITRSADVSRGQRELESARKRWQQQFESGELYAPADENAYLTLAALAALELPPQELAKLRRQLDQRAAGTINALLSSGQLDDARQAIAQLSALATPVVVAPLETRLQTLDRNQALQERRLAELLSEAARLEASGGDQADLTPALLPLYSEAVALAPRNRTAQKGLARSSRFALDASASAMETGQLAQAREWLEQLRRYEVGGKELAAQEARLKSLAARRAAAERQVKQVQQELAKLLAATPQNPLPAAKARRRAAALTAAWVTLEAASLTAPGITGLHTSRQQVKSAYSSEFETHLKDNDLQVAKIYLDALVASGLATADANRLTDTMASELDRASQTKPERFPSF